MATGKSPNTLKAYLPRIGRFLNWCLDHGVDWHAIGLADLSRFKNRVQASPTRHGSSPSGKTVNATLVAVCEFLRFAAAHEYADAQVSELLSQPRYLQYLPAGFNPGESNQFRMIQARVLKAPEIESAPQTIDKDAQVALCRSARTSRDRFLIAVLLHAGLRIGEALGLRRGDLHMLPTSAHLGCPTRGAHLHVRPRQDNTNGARSKSHRPRVVPLNDSTVDAYSDYLTERARIVQAEYCDYVFVNLQGPNAGRPTSYSNVKQIIERLGHANGFRARPHMMRHTAATQWVRAGVAVDVVQTLLGHASQASTAVYLHAWDEDLREAVTRVDAGRR